jgi:uncharacterized membrane protein
VHFPIALIVIGTLVELFSFLGWRGSGFRRGGRWMLLLGAVTAVPATFSGLYAYNHAYLQDMVETKRSNPLLDRIMWQHVWSQAVATTAAIVLVAGWIGMTDFWRDRLSVLFKLGLIGVSGLILWGAHLGGEQVYGHAVGVSTTQPQDNWPEAKALTSLKTWEKLAPVVQTHVTMAGLALAVSAVTLGIAIRMVTTGPDVASATDHTGRIAAAFNPAALDDPTLPPVDPPLVVRRNYTPPVWATKFWLLSALLLTVTALLGDWIIASHIESWNLEALWNEISKPILPDDPALTRRLAHFIVGGTLIVDTLILALLARFAPRRSVLLLVFSVPLVLAMAAQIWLGVLLMFDGPQGAVTRFNG